MEQTVRHLAGAAYRPVTARRPSLLAFKEFLLDCCDSLTVLWSDTFGIQFGHNMQSATQLFAAAVEPEWEPAFGEFGWLWISLGALAIFIAYKLFQRNREQERARIEHEKQWGQRDGESTEDWQSRVKLQEEEIENWRREREIKAQRNREQSLTRRSRRSVYNDRGDFDPPGGWGAMGPG
jgi:hypothetical protein